MTNTDIISLLGGLAALSIALQFYALRLARKESLKYRIKTLDIKDRLLVITSDDSDVNYKMLEWMDDVVKSNGGIATIFIDKDSTSVESSTLDYVILQLQAMQKKKAQEEGTL